MGVFWGCLPNLQPEPSGFARRPLGPLRPSCYVGLVPLSPGRSGTTASLGGRGPCGLLAFTAVLMIVAGGSQPSASYFRPRRYGRSRSGAAVAYLSTQLELAGQHRHSQAGNVATRC